MHHLTKTMIATSLLTFAATSYAAPAASVNVTPAERAKIEEVVHQYLLQKPEVIMEAIQILQRQQYQQAEQTAKQTQQSALSYSKELFHQANDPIAGNPNGKVTVVEFFDYQCPHCIDMAPVMESAIKSNPDLRVIYKEFPIRGPMSDLAARAALAANKQGKYLEFSHALLTANRPLTQDLISQLAKTVGLNVDQLKKDMEDKAIVAQLKANIKLAKDLKLFGTPAFFIGKTDGGGRISYAPGQMDIKQLQDAIDNVGK